mgnify:FL=1
MEPRITLMLLGLGLLAGLLFGSGEVGSGVLLAVTAAALTWLLRADVLRRDSW